MTVRLKVAAIGAVTFAIVLGVGVLSWSYHDGKSADVGSGPHAEMVSQCQQAVRDKLKAPSTAAFGPMDARTPMKSAPGWVYRSWVDSQNSFGALLWADFECDVFVKDGRVVQVVPILTQRE
ncbi:hypothetical protein D5S18_02910 [Nocardia panacis]|uniref:Uncharacterized protein n=1 Tax=Nocardia panacis TaxID=2340916 RepID=A0A3A4KBQ4_9NOCA|nr:hypothetical protein [Nocardia panacis]RJO79297.1 hypothetical protein D5S18_02910 [Nocardia panacis]